MYTYCYFTFTDISFCGGGCPFYRIISTGSDSVDHIFLTCSYGTFCAVFHILTYHRLDGFKGAPVSLAKPLSRTKHLHTMDFVILLLIFLFDYNF